jgi:hypothetical protein
LKLGFRAGFLKVLGREFLRIVALSRLHCTFLLCSSFLSRLLRFPVLPVDNGLHVPAFIGDAPGVGSLSSRHRKPLWSTHCRGAHGVVRLQNT